VAPDSVPVSSSAAAPQDAATLAADHGYGGLTYFPKAKISKSKPNPPLPTSTRTLLDSVLHLDSLPDIPDDEFLENLLLTLTQHNKANPITSETHDTEAVPQALNLFHHIGGDDMLRRLLRRLQLLFRLQRQSRGLLHICLREMHR